MTNYLLVPGLGNSGPEHWQTYFQNSEDIWVSLDRAKFFADSWGSEFINIGKAGHINAASGHTNWEEGMRILKTIV